MEVTFSTTIPDDVAAGIQNGSNTPLVRRLMELAAIKAYEAGLITRFQVQEMLGYETRFDVDALFKTYEVIDRSFTLAELERERVTAAALFVK
jgi:hypothetical protein